MQMIMHKNCNGATKKYILHGAALIDRNALILNAIHKVRNWGFLNFMHPVASVGNAHLACVLTARYCGPSEFSPVRFPHMEAALSCCICCCSCWAMRFCSLSFCVSANFTTMGEEQPWGKQAAYQNAAQTLKFQNIQQKVKVQHKENFKMDFFAELAFYSEHSEYAWEAFSHQNQWILKHILQDELQNWSVSLPPWSVTGAWIWWQTGPSVSQWMWRRHSLWTRRWEAWKQITNFRI